MGSNEAENRLPNGDVPTVHRNIDWSSRYDLCDPEAQRDPKRDDKGYDALGPEMYPAGANELFAQEYVSTRI